MTLVSCPRLMLVVMYGARRVECSLDERLTAFWPRMLQKMWSEELQALARIM